MVPLLDMIKETVLRIGLLEHFAPAGPRTGIDPAVLGDEQGGDHGQVAG